MKHTWLNIYTKGNLLEREKPVPENVNDDFITKGSTGAAKLVKKAIWDDGSE